MRSFNSPALRVPQVQLLSNGRYHVIVSSAGGGYSRWHDLALTRWREDATRDCWGTFIYLRDEATGEYWSVAYQPTVRPFDDYETIFTRGSAEVRQRRNELETRNQICVSPEDDVELRRVMLTNHSAAPRTIQLTSYAEVVLTHPGADVAHPTFSNLFVQTEFVRTHSAILCKRRPRSEKEQTPWFVHAMAGEHGAQDVISCETDRARFIGRGRTSTGPMAMERDSSLSNTTGSVLDPIVSLRRTFVVAPAETVRVDFTLGVAENREAALALAEKYHDFNAVGRSFDSAKHHDEVAMLEFDGAEAELEMYEGLAGALVYADTARRADARTLLRNRRGQTGLWSLGVSGDIPIVLLHARDPAKIGMVRQLIQAHALWRRKGLAADLIVLSQAVGDLRQRLHDQIIDAVKSRPEVDRLEKPGGIFVRRSEEVAEDDRVLLESAARVVLSDESGIGILAHDAPGHGLSAHAHGQDARDTHFMGRDAHATIFHNGLGGFTPDGREYAITLQPGQTAPAPWVNVLANPNFGTVVSESGGAYTWAENSHEFRLTPWNNDPITDASGEAFYLRDEESGHFWSPTPLPAPGATPYVIRHGFGYSVFEHTERGIISELTIYVATDAPVKFAAFRLRNDSDRPRRISITGYWEWVLGDSRERSLLHVQTEMDPETGALLARNFFNPDFSDRIASIDVDDPLRTITGDRNEFCGRNGTPANPAALKQVDLSGATGAGLDPCGAVRVTIDLPAGQECEAGFRLGTGRSLAEVQELIGRFRGTRAGQAALEEVRRYWRETLGTVQIETPDPSVNVLANGWLLYQTLSCRLWGRTGFYQSGGAFGFRDQLQDVMALVHAEPGLVREHLLRAATHQFREGDVLHWWHPPTGRGVRTRVSDDYLWLPYVTCRYVSCIGDTSVLDEQVPYLEGRPVKPEEESYYDLPNRSEASDTVYQHCARAIEHGLRFGAHGLPLIGTCDWNDGMNLVGSQGRGESVWLGFFLYDVLIRFADLARGRNDSTFAERCVDEAQRLKENIERHGWDGEWYRRAYFDNGAPLGSQRNSECQIDSLPQSWSVLSGAGDAQRARQAMKAVNERLVRRDGKLIQLLDPPFDRSEPNPGYIKGYVPGVRENGGQYTHAAVWVTMAFAYLEDYDRAWELVALLNPINHGATAADVAVYKVEPYVVAADVYAVAPHTGRGGWSWYTGSAGWLYRLLIETLLGLNLEGNRLRLTPRLPKEWAGFGVHYRYRQTLYHINVSKPSSDSLELGRTLLDGEMLSHQTVPLVDDRREHHVDVRLGKQ
jgi:cyclic beta-1,2-glucan glucanotransferase